MSPEKLLNAEQVADVLGVPIAHIYRLSREDKLPTIRIGKYVRYSPSALVEFVANGGTTGTAS
jgi:excisionase family DNA binding protein